MIALLLPADQAARRSQCSTNLKQIGSALQCYHDANKCFPAAVVTDENGTPRYSWRVAILPYIEQAPLYEQYDPNIAWDAPGNDVVRMTKILNYQCPSANNTMPNETNYVMIVGNGTVGGLPNESTKYHEIRDGTANTIMVVEVVGSGIEWSEPRDLAIEQLSMAVNNGTGNGPSSNHPGGLNALFCDGAVHFISEGIAPEDLECLLLRDDGGQVYLP